METSGNDGESKKDLDDSGCVQDVGPPLQQTELEEELKPAGLMDLSDDVLLYILRYCCPRDLKALGYTCPRLGRLIRDRTLWTRVDARAQPTGRARMRWLLAHALTKTTTELLLEGYAREARGCLGHVNRKRKEVEDEKAAQREKNGDSSASTSRATPREDANVQIVQVDPLTRLQQLMRPNSHNSLHTPNRFGGTPSWPEDGAAEVDPEDVVLLDGSCPGPQFTLTQCMLRQLRSHCSLTSLALQFCNINCNTTGIAHFPPTLKKLSLRGAKCYNLPLDKSFLFNIQDYLPQLEYLDLSECEWLEPASLLPLSKVTTLKHLVMRDCYRLSEFVAYASLATRYGFRKLEILDVRGSPVADSEVSALGWLPALAELFVSPAPRAPPPPRDHSHYRDEPLPDHRELEPWELEEPDYFKIKPQIVEPMDPRPNMTIDDIEEHIEQLRDYENNICLHGTEYNLCMEGIRKTSRKRPAATEIPSFISVTPPKREMVEPTTSNADDTPTECSSAENREMNEKDSAQEGVCPKRKDIDKVDDESGPSTKKKKLNQPDPNDQEPSCSSKRDEDTTTSSKKTSPKTKNSDDSASSDDENVPLKMLCQNDVNAGASTSKDPSSSDPTPGTTPPSTCKKPEAHPKDCDCTESNTYEFVRFRQNMDPVIVTRDRNEVDRENEDRENRDREARDREMAEELQNREIRPRAHVLYVNVGQQLHTVYRLSIHNEPPIFYSFAGNSHLRFRPNVGNIFYTPPTPHLDATSLVSDSAVRRFGRADVDDVSYIHIGPRPNGPGDPGARPNRSSLRVLSLTGFRNITDRSLVHLATAAPNLQLIDFSETRVTAQGVENFKSLRPDCEVRFSEYVEKED